MDGAALFLYVGGLIEERKLDANRTVKIVQKITPVFKDQIFVLILRQLVVDVVELHLLGEIPLRNNADAVPAHLLVRDGLLGGAGNFAVPLGLLDGCGQPPLLHSRELRVRCQADAVAQICLIFSLLLFCCLQRFYLFCLLFLQSHLPPSRGGSAAPKRRINSPSDRGGPWGQETVPE